MNQTVKKIIAGEGLIILALVIIGYILIVSASFLFDYSIARYSPDQFERDYELLVSRKHECISAIRRLIIFGGIAVYFAVWAIRTLRKK